MAGNHKVALVIDDVVSFDPFVARGIRVYGRAEPPVEREGMVGPGNYLGITPVISWSWNMEGKPVGDSWYESPAHSPPAPVTPLTAGPVRRAQSTR